MTEEEILIAHFEKSRAEYEQRSKELIPVRMKIALEGFECDVDKFEIATELVLRRAELAERQAIWSRTNNPRDVEQKANDNEFFAEFDFEIPRGSVQGLAPSEGMTIVSIFFAVCSGHILNINKGNFYLKYGDEYRSAGFHTSPNEYRFFTKTSYSDEDLKSIKNALASFQKSIPKQSHFCLSCPKILLLRFKSVNRRPFD